MIATSSMRWYVAQTQSRSEARAAAHLDRQGFGVYLPRYLKRRRHARKVDTVAAPLFPRYLFVAVDMAAQRWRAIQSTLGVARIVCNGDRPAVVDDNIIENLKQRESSLGMIELDDGPRFQPGDRIRVAEGVFSASLGLYEGLTDRDRVTILLDLLGRKVRVMLDVESLVSV